MGNKSSVIILIIYHPSIKHIITLNTGEHTLEDTISPVSNLWAFHFNEVKLSGNEMLIRQIFFCDSDSTFMLYLAGYM